MPYGVIKVDQVTFTNAGVDQTISVSGIVASISGNITATGTISGNVIRGGTVSGATVTGTAGRFGTVTGNTAGFTTVTGTTVTGTTASFTSGVFTSISGGTHTITSGVFASGTAAAPSITFAGDLDTGVYASAANQVAITTSGTERMRIDSTGKVGIGTSSPAISLDVTPSSANTVAARFGNIAERGLEISTFLTQSTSDAGVAFNARGAGKGAFTFQTDSTERARIDSSGRLLVGTSSNRTGAALQVEGTSFGTSLGTITNNSANSAPAYFQLIKSRGTSIGSQALVANGDGLGNIQFVGTDGTQQLVAAAIEGIVDGTPGANDMPGRLVFFTTADGANSPTERMRIDSSGRVGIGTSSPSAALQVNGSTTVTSQANVAAQIGANLTSDVLIGSLNGNTPFIASQGAYPLQLRTNNTVALTIDSSQRVGIGTASPESKLDVVGSGTQTIRSATTDASGTAIGRFRAVYTGGGGGTQSAVDLRAGDNYAYLLAENVPLLFGTNNTERARIDSSGRLLVGTSSARVNFFNSNVTSTLQIENQLGIASITRSANDVFGGTLVLAKNRGGANTVVQSGDTVSLLSFQGNDGSEFVEAANISVVVDATPGANDMPGRLVFSTTADGAGSPTERMRIDSSGRVGIGTTSPAGRLNIAYGTGGVAVNDGLYLTESDISGIYTSSLRFNGLLTHLYGDRSGGELRLENNGTGAVTAYTNGSERARIDSSGRLLVGTSFARSNYYSSVTPGGLQSETGTLAVFQNSNNTTGSALYIGKSRGTTANSNTVVQADDQLGTVVFFGADGTNVWPGAQITALVDGTPGANDMPGRLVFSTTADGANSPTERMRIDSAGNVGVGTASPVHLLHVDNGVLAGGRYGAPGSLVLRSASGTQSIPTAISTSTNVSVIVGRGYDGTVYRDVAAIGINSDGAISSTSSPGFISFNTTPAGSVATTEKARIDSSGRLLVGTSSAYAVAGFGSADINLVNQANIGSIACVSTNNNTFGANLLLGKSRGGTTTIVQNGDTLGQIRFGGADGIDLNTTGASIQAIVDGTPGADDLPSRLVFFTTADGASSPTERMRISSSGQIAVAGAGSASAPTITKNDDLNTGIFFPAADTIAFAEGGTESARFDSSGRLLVGTSTILGTTGKNIESANNIAISTYLNNAFGYELTFNKSRGSTNGTIVQNGDNIGNISWRADDGTDTDTVAAQISAVVDGTPGANDMPGRLVFSTTADGASSPTERMRITSAGDVLVSATDSDPAINGTASAISLRDDGRISARGPDNFPAMSLARGGTDGAIVKFYKTTTDVGNISVTTTATAYNTSSDYRLKENVIAVTDGITRLQQLKPSRFNFIADPTKTVDGFLAHEVQAIVPEAITGEKDAADDEGNPIYQGIDQSKLVPLLTAALQEAIAKIKSLEARLTAAGI